MLGPSASSCLSSASRLLLATSPAARVTLGRVLASQVSSSLLVRQQQHAYSTNNTNNGTATTSSGSAAPVSAKKLWAMTPHQRRQNTTTGVASLRQRAQRGRPIINGEAVAFHVNDLLDCAPSSVSVSPSSAANNNGTSQTWTRRSYESDLVVILDMDECMIHSQFLSSPAAAQVYAHQLKAQQRQMNTAATAIKKQVDSFRFPLPDGDLVHVHVRPGLTDFLKAVTDRFETHVFTAAVDLYAKPLLDRLDPTGTMFAGRWYREHCAYDAQQGAYVKDLSRLPVYTSENPHRVVLVDNNPLSFLANPSNGILVSSFYNDAGDETLPAVWDLLQELDGASDVRPILDEKFGLKLALRDVSPTKQEL